MTTPSVPGHVAPQAYQSGQDRAQIFQQDIGRTPTRRRATSEAVRQAAIHGAWMAHLYSDDPAAYERACVAAIRDHYRRGFEDFFYPPKEPRP